MSGGALPAGMSPAVGSDATGAELDTTAAGAGLPNAPQMSSTQLAMQGLMGALTGSPQYGANAPAIHKALTGFLQPAQGARSTSATQPQRRAASASVPGITSFTGVTPTTGNVTPPTFQQGSVQSAIQSLAPWMSNGQF